MGKRYHKVTPKINKGKQVYQALFHDYQGIRRHYSLKTYNNRKPS